MKRDPPYALAQHGVRIAHPTDEATAPASGS